MFVIAYLLAVALRVRNRFGHRRHHHRLGHHRPDRSRQTSVHLALIALAVGAGSLYEVFNEINRDEIVTAMIAWCDDRLAGDAAQQVAVHDPAVSVAQLCASLHYLRRHVTQSARDQHLVGHADVGTPEHLELRIVESGGREPRVEHHDRAVEAGGQAVGDAAGGSDVDGFADAVERDSVGRRQGVHARHAGDDRILERHPVAGQDVVDDPQRAVVERRVAPDQERTDPVVAELDGDGLGEAVGARGVPVGHGVGVGSRGAVSWRVGDLDDAVAGRVADVPAQDLVAHRQQPRLRGALVDDEQHLGPVQRLDGLDGDLVRVSWADTDDEDVAHRLSVMHVRVLVLGGTAEARGLADRLIDLGAQVITSLAGAVRNPALPAGEVRVGGFGGAAGLAAYLRERGPELVVDATHPFAAVVTKHAVAACSATSIPLLVLRRPPWAAGPRDVWTRVPSIDAAAAHVRARPPGTVFLTTGRRDLAAFADDNAHAYLVRSVEPPEGRAPARTTVVLDRGPYRLDGELALMRAHDVALLVTKDSGGAATAAKLEAARQLGVAVVVVDRPAPPIGVTTVDGVAAVLSWCVANGSLDPPSGR